MKKTPVAWDLDWGLKPCLMFKDGKILDHENSKRLYPEFFNKDKPIWNKLPIANDLDPLGDFDGEETKSSKDD